MTRQILLRMVLTTCLWAIGLGTAKSAMLYLEDFDDGANGWAGRDGEMTVGHDAGNEWMSGAFGATFLPQTDVFRATANNFTGDYVTPGLTQISFELYSDDVLPSSLFINLISGANTFYYQFTPVNNLNSWQTFTVNLAYSFGWSGGEAAFNLALNSIDNVEIELTRNGNLAQNYYLDNVQTLQTDIGDPGGPGGGVVPEPATFSLFVCCGALVFGLRKYLVKHLLG